MLPGIDRATATVCEMLRQIIRGVLALPSHQELPPLHRGHSKQLSQTMLAATTAAVVVTQSRIKCPAGSPAVARQSQPTAVPCYRHEQNDNKTPNTPKQGEVRTFSCTYVGGSVSHGGHDGHPSLSSLAIIGIRSGPRLHKTWPLQRLHTCPPPWREGGISPIPRSSTV